MNYKEVYQKIISYRTQNRPEGVFERHHILPRSLGGNNDRSNLVDLTPREHFICHMLLAKIYGGPMTAAFFFMSHPNSNSARGVRLNSRTYDIARKMFSSFMKERVKGTNNPNYGKTHPPRVRKILSETRSKYTKRKHPKALNEKTNWIHKSGEMFFGSHFDLSKHTGLDSCSLRRVSKGTFFSYKGWMCPDSGRENMREGENTNTADTRIYTWISPDGRRVRGTRYFIRKTEGLTQSGASCLVLGTLKTHKGWSVCL